MPRDAAEPLPGIIVIHEWWGLNDNIKAMTRRLAGEGYVVLAVDLYGGATAETPEAAQALMTALLAEPEAARRNLRQAYDYLEKYALAPRIASLGWCLGRGVVAPDGAAVSGHARRDGHVLRPSASRTAIASRR